MPAQPQTSSIAARIKKTGTSHASRTTHRLPGDAKSPTEPSSAGAAGLALHPTSPTAGENVKIGHINRVQTRNAMLGDMGRTHVEGMVSVPGDWPPEPKNLSRIAESSRVDSSSQSSPRPTPTTSPRAGYSSKSQHERAVKASRQNQPSYAPPSSRGPRGQSSQSPRWQTGHLPIRQRHIPEFSVASRPVAPISMAPSAIRSVVSSPADQKMASQQAVISSLPPPERKAQESWAQAVISRTSQCPQNYAWERRDDHGGYQCAGKNHFVPDALVAEGKGGVYFVPEASLSSGVRWGPYYQDPPGSGQYMWCGAKPKGAREVDGWLKNAAGEVRFFYNGSRGRVYGPPTKFLPPDKNLEGRTPAQEFERMLARRRNVAPGKRAGSQPPPALLGRAAPSASCQSTQSSTSLRRHEALPPQRQHLTPDSAGRPSGIRGPTSEGSRRQVGYRPTPDAIDQGSSNKVGGLRRLTKDSRDMAVRSRAQS
ncbi:hypothetical protein PZA11_004612 [Diplocarpon coronariae]